MIAALMLTALAPTLQMSLKLDRTEFRIGESAGLKVEIKNLGTETVRLIKIQDGSSWHWMNPKVGWSLQPIDRTPIIDEIPKIESARCGNVNPLTRDSFFSLKKGEIAEIDLAWSFPFININPGEFRLAFHYEISKDLQPTKSVGLGTEECIKEYRSLTPVKLRSNVVRIKISP